jgi:hypothetical protein
MSILLASMVVLLVFIDVAALFLCGAAYIHRR